MEVEAFIWQPLKTEARMKKWWKLSYLETRKIPTVFSAECSITNLFNRGKNICVVLETSVVEMLKKLREILQWYYCYYGLVACGSFLSTTTNMENIKGISHLFYCIFHDWQFHNLIAQIENI